jgi:hypothetical protein
VQLALGPDSIPVQLFANQLWQPMVHSSNKPVLIQIQFLSSESPALEEYLTPINSQIEDQSQTENPMTITNLLNMFGVAYNSASKPAPIAPNHFTNFPLHSSIAGLSSLHLGTDQGTDGERKVVVPTVEDWENLILPETKKALQKENFQQYEIDEWFRRIQVIALALI